MFGQGLGEVGPGKELFRILVVGGSLSVYDLIQCDGELVGIEGAALANFLAGCDYSVPRVHIGLSFDFLGVSISLEWVIL